MAVRALVVAIGAVMGFVFLGEKFTGIKIPRTKVRGIFQSR